MNILTFDVEEWFHLLDNDSTRSEEQWNNYEVRIYENMERVFRILEETNTKATFFIIGWIAKTYPDIVKRIAEKYQIGSHTMNHQLVWQQSPSEFKQDVESSIKLLEDITGKKVELFRAPGFSIRESESWAFEILSELGITTDCSVFPAKASHGGMPSYTAEGPAIIEHNGIKLKEFPISTKEILGHHIVYGGGGYFRLCPYSLIKNWTKKKDYSLSYIHPRDLDAGQPMIKELNALRRFKSYVGLKTAEEKLKRFLTDFNFIDVSTADKIIDWEKKQTIIIY
ncbi:MAG: polysaccharide deacetylase family protein [Treponema sp.]|nr:polysaccharide deacetylase family protein [Treponema sp.]